MADSEEGEDPATSARRAVKGQSEGATPTPQAPETRSQDPEPDESGGSKGSNRDGFRDYAAAAMDAEADGPDVEEVQSDYDLRRGPAHMLRSILRTAGCIDLPPVGEAAYGVVLTVRDRSEDGEEVAESDEESEESEATVEQADGPAGAPDEVPAA